MSDPTIERVSEILETDPDFYVPVKKLWLMVQADGLATDTELSEFQAMLEADDRFEFAEGVDHNAGFEDDPELAAEMQAEMEALGFFSGPRVKLTSREMTKEDVFAAMARHLQRMNDALLGAWETRPDDPEVEDDLIDLLLASQRLGREMSQLIAGELPPEDDVEDTLADQPDDTADERGDKWPPSL